MADAYPAAGLAPPPGPSPERADYLQMLHFGSTWMDMMLWQIRIHEHVLTADQRDDRTIVRYRHKFATEAEPVWDSLPVFRAARGGVNVPTSTYIAALRPP